MKYTISFDEYYGPDAEPMHADYPFPENTHELTDEEHAKVRKFKQLRWEVEQMLCAKIGMNPPNFPPK